jgi:NAD(P)-dependent dehydrogenase (short-subunit alcohol dehydrogenase family)
MLNVVAMDVTDAESVRNAATQLKDVAIDLLINSAGIAGAPGQKTGNVNYESWAHEFNVNTMGPLRVVGSFSDHIAPQPGRRKQAPMLGARQGACSISLQWT